MPGKSIQIEIDGDNPLKISYEGFVGNSCFAEADRIRAAMSALGLDVEVVKVDRTKDEVEVRKLKSSQSVGS